LTQSGPELNHYPVLGFCTKGEKRVAFQFSPFGFVQEFIFHVMHKLTTLTARNLSYF